MSPGKAHRRTSQVDMKEMKIQLEIVFNEIIKRFRILGDYYFEVQRTSPCSIHRSPGIHACTHTLFTQVFPHNLLDEAPLAVQRLGISVERTASYKLIQKHPKINGSPISVLLEHPC
jgi:hypothetical protein